MVTVEQLRNMLEKYPAGAEVTWVDGSEVIHIATMESNRVVLSDRKPMGYCRKCGGYAYPETQLAYPGYCPSEDENLFEFEIERREVEK